MEILTRTLCKSCHGEGIAQNPLWTEFWKTEEGKPGDGLNERVYEFFRARGYPCSDKEGGAPQEVVACPFCKSGYAEKWVNAQYLIGDGA